MNWCTLRVVAFIVLISSCFGQCQADIALPNIFSDNMVLQRETKTRIHGTAEPQQKLTIQFGDVLLKTTTGSDGKWSVMMPTGKAGGPFELIVTAVASQPQIRLSNVMVGEVWLCAGESNMRWPVSEVVNAPREIQKSIELPSVRFFAPKQKTSRLPLGHFNESAGWGVCSPETVADFSAVGYFFAQELKKTFPNVPIGLIMSVHDHTTCEAWTSHQGLESVPRFQPMLEYWDSREDESLQRPDGLFNAMIAPLQDVQIRGVLWYQGESNNGRGEQYATLFPTLIADWRRFFNKPELPFYFVQLAPFRYERKSPESLPELWDAQLKTLRQTKNSGMVVTSDIADTTTRNPKNKQEVGRRLALLALQNVYRNGLPATAPAIVCSGPIYESMQINGRQIRLNFQNSQGLKSKHADQPLIGFAVAGADQKFFPAQAQIINDAVELTCPVGITPVAVRFGWTDTFVSPLFNAADLPASSFRTDNFRLISEGKDF